MITEQEQIKQHTRELLIKGGKTIYEIAEIVGKGKTYVSTLKQALEQETEDQAIEAVSTLSPQLVLRMADLVREQNPQMAQDLTHLSGGLDSLEKLQPQLHRTVGTLLTKCDEAMNRDDIKPADFRMYAELALKAYATMQNTSGINFNMNTQNNTVVQSAVSERLGNLMKGIIPMEENNV